MLNKGEKVLYIDSGEMHGTAKDEKAKDEKEIIKLEKALNT